MNENTLSILFFFPSIFFFHRFCMTTFVFNVFLKSFAQEIGTKPNKINTFSMLNFCSSEVNRRSTQTQSPPYDPLWRTRFLSSSFGWHITHSADKKNMLSWHWINLKPFVFLISSQLLFSTFLLMWNLKKVYFEEGKTTNTTEFFKKALQPSSDS